jgi:hypothetical protein
MADHWKLPELSGGEWIHGFYEEPVHACFFDYGTIERQPTLAKVLRSTKRVIYVDDADLRADCKEMRDCVFRSVTAFNFPEETIPQGTWGMKDCTEAEDEFSRWGMLLNWTF